MSVDHHPDVTQKSLTPEGFRPPKAPVIPIDPRLTATTTASLGLALVISSNTPLVLLDETMLVLAASGSFCQQFGLDPAKVAGTSLFALGDGEWSRPQLRALLQATASGSANIEAYEMDLVRAGVPDRCILIHAHVLEYTGADRLKMVMAVSDVTDARLAERQKDALVRDKQTLMDELQHRVANSLQIIASVLMQSARKVNSEETKRHLHDAHHRVMSIATLQKQLAVSKVGEVGLRDYFKELCASIGASMIPDADVIALGVTVDNSHTSADTSVSLGLIVTELVINALKHAFPDGRRGRITVDYSSTGDVWALSIGDDGIGMNAAQQPSKAGLGTGIVEALARQLEATVVVSDTMPGTMVRVSNDGALDTQREGRPALIAV
jgi:two-component system, sensor histidine kinase PdtaS